MADNHRQKGLSAVTVMGLAAIVTLGVLIVNPIIQAARPPTPGSHCLSNVKQLDLAVLLYSNDNDDRMPIAGVWYDAARPYAHASGMPTIDFRCPAVPETFNGAPSVGYAFNELLSIRVPKETDDQARTISVYESANLLKNATDPVSSLPFHGRHDGRNTFGYWDGHAKAHMWSENPGLVRP